MSIYADFLLETERRQDEIRQAEASRQGKFLPTGPILVEQLVKLLGSVRRQVKTWFHQPVVIRKTTHAKLKKHGGPARVAVAHRR